VTDSAVTAGIGVTGVTGASAIGVVGRGTGDAATRDAPLTVAAARVVRGLGSGARPIPRRDTGMLMSVVARSASDVARGA
jgi:hypothetical protein